MEDIIGKLRENFREEAYELLAELEAGLLELEHDPGDMEQFGRVFRAIHTIKGSGATCEFHNIAVFTHELETMFDKIRKGKIAATKEIINLALTARDHIQSLFDAFYKGGAADESQGAEITATLRKLFSDFAAKRPVAPAPSAAKGKPTREEPAKTEPKRILIVDDEPTILLTLSYALRSSGVEVITASRLEPAEEALARYAFDLVIVDIRMSGILGIEGLELLSYIKRYWPKTKVIVMTAHGSTEIKQEAYDRGASYYYEKPVDILELAERVRNVGLPTQG